MLKCCYICFLLTCLVSITYGQIEICNNAIDDDGDGLIDINDEDCICPETVPSGLIPNPSFEGMICCPSSEAQLDCAESWIQASAATSDYFHTCNGFTYPQWLGTSYRTPTPLPDGNGWVGFRNGKPGNPQFKEYVGACLNATMEVGKTYRIDFYLGFPNNTSFEGIEMTFFAHEDCTSIPFGNNQSNIGCPTNSPGWTQLNQVYVEGRNEWINLTVEFTADKPYNVFILGPGCVQHPDFQNEPYYFVDRLALAETNEFDVPFAQIIGDICDEDLTLVAPDGNYTYQWYKDGIALIGETDESIDIPVDVASEGNYQVVFGVGTSCFFSEEFDLQVPDKLTEITEEICEGDIYEVANQVLTATDVYEFYLFSSLGCDSTIIVDLTVHPNEEEDIQRTICQGESIIIEGDVLTEPGFYTYDLTSSKDCDSTLYLVLNVDETKDSIITPRICQGEFYTIEGDDLEFTGTYDYNLSTTKGCDSLVTIRLIVFNATLTLDEYNLCDDEVYTIGGDQLSEPGDYEFILENQLGCDSVVTVILTKGNSNEGLIYETLCPDETFEFFGADLANAGTYFGLTTNISGCDSNVILELSETDVTASIELGEDIEASLGDIVTITPAFVHPSITAITWTSSDIIDLTQDGNDVSILAVSNVQLTANAVDENGCTISDDIMVRVSRDIGIYPPNIFSPNGDNANDFWKIIVSKSIASLEHITLYDRWGNLVYYERNVTNVNSMIGWDGNINGSRAAEGVYVYHAIFKALDGLEETVIGDLTLVR